MNLNALAVNYNKKRPTIEALESHLKKVLLSSNANAGEVVRFMDVGCGAGQISEFLLNFSAKACVTGLDVTDGMINQCLRLKRKFGSRCDFIKTDVNENYESIAKFGVFDFLLFSQSIHFIKNDALTYLISNSVKGNGRIIVVATLPGDLKKIPYCLLSEKVLNYERSRLWPLTKMTRFFLHNNFQLEYNERMILPAKLKDTRSYYLSRPFSALTILGDEEIRNAVDANIDSLVQSDILDIFNLIVFKKELPY